MYESVAPTTAVPAPAPRVTAAPVSRRAVRPMRVQAKLIVGSSHDPLEREADRIADHAVAMFAGGPAAVGSTGAVRSAPVTRISRFALIGAAGGAVDAETEHDITMARPNGRPLDSRIRRTMEDAIGADFSGVRLHVGARSDALNERVQSRAFTTGSDVFIRRQDHVPDTAAGRRLLAHELAHTVQQGAAPRLRRQLVGTIQRDDKTDAVALETADRLESSHYGHALDRHGPDVSDAALKKRLQTGEAPDGAMVPVAGPDALTGISSKFAGHKEYLETRAAACVTAKERLDATADRLKGLAETAKKAIEALASAAQAEKGAKAKERATAMKALTDAADSTRASVNGDKWAPIDVADKKQVESLVKAGGDQLNALFTLRPEYEMVIDHGKPIGYGFQGSSPQNIPKPGAPGKEMRVFDDAVPVKLDMPKTRSTFKVKGPTSLIAKTYTPTAWAVIQHFPADDPVGMRIKGAV
jgi:hypothetical protein